MSAGKITFHGAVPILRVRDLAASVDHYARVLGFSVDWHDRGIMAGVSRGKCHIMICEGDQGHPGGWVWIGVSDAGALENELIGARREDPAPRHELSVGLRDAGGGH